MLEPQPSVASGKPKIKKPPRKSKLQEEKSVKNLTESGSGENWEEKNNEGESPAVSSTSAGRMTAIMSKLKTNSFSSPLNNPTL